MSLNVIFEITYNLKSSVLYYQYGLKRLTRTRETLEKNMLFILFKIIFYT